MADKFYISQIKLPSGSVYEIKDTEARQRIDDLVGVDAVRFMGVSSTILTDGGNEDPTIDNIIITTKKSGDLYFYGLSEFIYGDDNKWHALGDMPTLGNLAYADTASTNFTPAGVINFVNDNEKAEVVTGSGEVTYTPSGSISLTQTEKRLLVMPTQSGDVTYTPTGNVSITVTPSTTDVYSITDVGTLPSCTLPELTTTVSNEVLTIGFNQGAFDAGTLPVKGTAQTVVNNITNASASFTGTGTRFETLVSTPDSASFSGTGVHLETGNISVPQSASFSGTGGKITVTPDTKS